MFFCKPQWKRKEMCVVKQQTQEKPKKSHEQDILQKHSQIDWSINICILRNACHELLCVFGDCYASGTQDAEVKKITAMVDIF